MEIREAIYWLNKALFGMNGVRGICARQLQIKKNGTEWNYYQPGKVFRFQNMFTAKQIGPKDQIQYDKSCNVCFHIYSVQGR